MVYPVRFLVGRYLYALRCIGGGENGGYFSEPLQFCLACHVAPHLRKVYLTLGIRWAHSWLPHQYGYGYWGARTLVKDSVTLLAAQLATGAAVAPQVIDIHIVPLGLNAAAHALLAVAINPCSIRYKCHHATALPLFGYAVARPAKRLYIGVVESFGVIRTRFCRISAPNSVLQLWVALVLGVVVGTLLAHGVGWVAPNDR